MYFIQRVTALAAGKLDDSLSSDALLVGTPTNLLAYDPERNADLFYKDVPDGVNALTVGRMGAGDSNNQPCPTLAIVGGNCSIQGNCWNYSIFILYHHDKTT